MKVLGQIMFFNMVWNTLKIFMEVLYMWEKKIYKNNKE